MLIFLGIFYALVRLLLSPASDAIIAILFLYRVVGPLHYIILHYYSIHYSTLQYTIIVLYLVLDSHIQRVVLATEERIMNK